MKVNNSVKKYSLTGTVINFPSIPLVRNVYSLFVHFSVGQKTDDPNTNTSVGRGDLFYNSIQNRLKRSNIK